MKTMSHAETVQEDALRTVPPAAVSPSDIEVILVTASEIRQEMVAVIAGKRWEVGSVRNLG